MLPESDQGMGSSLDETLSHLIALVQQLPVPSSSITTDDFPQIKAIICQTYSALVNSQSIVMNRHQECQLKCESLSIEKSRGEGALRKLKNQLKEMPAKRMAFKQWISAKMQMIRRYEDGKRNAQAERNVREETSRRLIHAIAGGILSVFVTLGIELPFGIITLENTEDNYEELERLDREVDYYQKSIHELISQLIRIQKKESELVIRMSIAQSERILLREKLTQLSQDLQATTQLSIRLGKARTLVSSLCSQATLMYEMNRQQVSLPSVLESLKDLMQVLHENGSVASSLATQSLVDELNNVWQVLENNI